MSIVNLFVILVLIGVGLYLINSVIPMVAWMRTVINILAVMLVVLWLLQTFGLYHLPVKIR